MLRPRLRIPLGSRPRLGLSARAQLLPLAQRIRSLHSVPELTQFNKEEGIPGLMDPDTFSMAWEQYQTHILYNLGRVTDGTEHEFEDLYSTIIKTAREPVKAPVFNHASMAHNNQFFFEGMHPTGLPMSSRLEGALTKSFGSIETLRLELVYTAAAMFGPGFVWLVKMDVPGNPDVFKVLVTYNAGSPYPAAHWRMQNMDTNTHVGEWSEEGLAAGKTYLERSAAGAGEQTFESKKRLSLAPGGANLVPVLCLNTWEHVWLRQFGFQVGSKSGKHAFAENWWHRINWERVEKLAFPATKYKSMTS